MKDASTRLKHGTVCPQTGRIFWGYNRSLKSGEYWMVPEKFHKAKAGQKAWESRQDSSSPRRQRNVGPAAAIRRAEYDQRKRQEDLAGFRAKTAAKMRKARKENVKFAITSRCRSRISSFLRSRGMRKNKATLAIIGCTWEQLREHLERQFLPGMSWENRRAWHVDHVIPLASAKTETECLKLCHYTNLQPLWALDNQKKQARVP